MKTDSFKLKQKCIAGYNATMQSAAMQAVMRNAISADKARQAAQEERYKKIDELNRELDRRLAAGEDVFVNYWTLTVEVK